MESDTVSVTHDNIVGAAKDRQGKNFFISKVGNSWLVLRMSLSHYGKDSEYSWHCVELSEAGKRVDN